MADEEEDYMSDAFLLGVNDSRPGLVSDRVAKEYKKEAKRKTKQEQNKVKPLKIRESEHREAGLTSAIDSSNKGFALLQKMGYKEGMGLGKSGELLISSYGWVSLIVGKLIPLSLKIYLC